ncbi:MAG: hypothetical protein NTV32_09810, partial [Gammaproteobacteria bacterium]|nr:hypothetical protein [Gammaproteobacteria bacterium]
FTANLGLAGTLTVTGNVGIGTTSPLATLAVTGTSTINPFVVSSSSGSSLFTIAPTGSTTISNLGTGIVQSSNGSLFISNQLGNASTSALTVGGLSYLSNTSITGTLTVSATTTLGSATTTINGVTYYWPSTQSVGIKILQNDGSGNLSWVADQTGGGGTLSGGVKGYVMVWASSTGATTGTMLDNVTVAGVNATSSSYSFNIQAGANINPFNVASSSGTSYLSVATNGSTTLSSLVSGIVRSTSAGALYNGLVSNADILNGTIDLTTKVTGILPVANGGTGANTLTAFNLLVGNGTGAVSTITPGTIFQVLRSAGSSANPIYSDIGSLITAGSNIAVTGTSTIGVSTTPTV